jgi:hypothetical protein
VVNYYVISMVKRFLDTLEIIFLAIFQFFERNLSIKVKICSSGKAHLATTKKSLVPNITQGI